MATLGLMLIPLIFLFIAAVLAYVAGGKAKTKKLTEVSNLSYAAAAIIGISIVMLFIVGILDTISTGKAIGEFVAKNPELLV